MYLQGYPLKYSRKKRKHNKSDFYSKINRWIITGSSFGGKKLVVSTNVGRLTEDPSKQLSVQTKSQVLCN